MGLQDVGKADEAASATVGLAPVLGTLPTHCRLL